MTIGWTQNIVILENCETAEERARFITAVRRFRWTKAKFLEGIILLETSKALSGRYKVRKLRFASGEFDVLVYDREAGIPSLSTAPRFAGRFQNDFSFSPYNHHV